MNNLDAPWMPEIIELISTDYRSRLEPWSFHSSDGLHFDFSIRINSSFSYEDIFRDLIIYDPIRFRDGCLIGKDIILMISSGSYEHLLVRWFKELYTCYWRVLPSDVLALFPNLTCHPGCGWWEARADLTDEQASLLGYLEHVR